MSPETPESPVELTRRLIAEGSPVEELEEKIREAVQKFLYCTDDSFDVIRPIDLRDFFSGSRWEILSEVQALLSTTDGGADLARELLTVLIDSPEALKEFLAVYRENGLWRDCFPLKLRNFSNNTFYRLIQEVPNISHLDILVPYGFDTDALRLLGRLKHLKRLALVDEGDPVRRSLDDSDIEALSGLSNLEELVIPGYSLEERGWGVISQFPSLKKLFVFAARFSSHELAVLVAGLRSHLTSLIFRRCRILGEDILKLEMLQELQYLAFDECDGFGYEDVYGLLVSGNCGTGSGYSSFPDLTRVDLSTTDFNGEPIEGDPSLVERLRERRPQITVNLI